MAQRKPSDPILESVVKEPLTDEELSLMDDVRNALYHKAAAQIRSLREELRNETFYKSMWRDEYKYLKVDCSTLKEKLDFAERANEALIQQLINQGAK